MDVLMLCTLLLPYILMQNMLQMNHGQSRLMTSFREFNVYLFGIFLCVCVYVCGIETEACPIPVMQIVLMLTGQGTSQVDQP